MLKFNLLEENVKQHEFVKQHIKTITLEFLVYLSLFIIIFIFITKYKLFIKKLKYNLHNQEYF